MCYFVLFLSSIYFPLSNSLKPIVRPSVRSFVRPAKSLLVPKGPSPPQELESSAPPQRGAELSSLKYFPLNILKYRCQDSYET